MMDIPAFSGIAGAMSERWTANQLGLRSIMKTSKVQFFTNCGENTLGREFFKFDDKRLVWSGGAEKNIDLNFNLSLNDNKFVLVEYEPASITLYTDHFSRIPLFYFVHKSTLFFATSLALLKKFNISEIFESNKDGLLFYYNFGFSNYDNFLGQVKSCSGGKKFRYDFVMCELKEEFYYDIFSNKKPPLKDEKIIKKKIDSALLKGTLRSLGNFNSIGIAMSGGVDSGYLAQKIHECGRSFQAYSIGYKGGYNEFDRIDFLAQELKFETRKIVINESEIIDNFLDLSSKSSYPVYFNNSILNFVYEEAQRDGIDVIFDGDGADRIFLGSNGFVRLRKVLHWHRLCSLTNSEHFISSVLKRLPGRSFRNLEYYFRRLNAEMPFYGLRQLSLIDEYRFEFEEAVDDLALPSDIPKNVWDKWEYFILFSIYYFSPCFLHNQYEFQLVKGITSNPQFWMDDIVDIALRTPVKYKLKGNKTKAILRDAARDKIPSGYWSLKKIGLENAWDYMKKTSKGKEFINSYRDDIIRSDDYLYLKEYQPQIEVDVDKLIPYHIWKKNLQ